MPKVAISDDFLTAFANVPRQAQRKVTAFVTKFRHDPRSSGINYENINDAADDNFRSVRIDQAYRGIVLKPEEGDVYVLLWVDKHDDAYDWARRHKCSINPGSGTLQILNSETQSTTDTVEDTVEPVPQVAPKVPAERPLQFTYERETLLRLGVPEELIDAILRLRSRDVFEALETSLPPEAFEALSFLADGIPLDEVLEEYAPQSEEKIDTENYAEALEREHTRRRFRVLEGELELLEMLSAPLEKWRVFLHPTQHKLVHRHWNGPVRVLGGAGTGKTVVAMHRAKWLAEHVIEPGSNQKVLFTTFTANLAKDIEENLSRICSPEILERIEVRNIDAWLHDFVRQFGLDYRVVYDGRGSEVQQLWDKAMAVAPAAPSLEESFYREEYRRVVQPQRVNERAAYFKASRVGRGVALTRKDRAAIWPVFESLRVEMRRAGVRFVEEAAFDAVDMLDSGAASRSYRSVVVDEAQDMGPEFMQLIGKLAGAEDRPKDSLFIVGDSHQRIYGRRFSLSKCGIQIRGRGRRLKINYRTTEETRRFATAILEGVEVDDLDEGQDSLSGYRSLVHGAPPVVKEFASDAEENSWLVTTVNALLQANVQAETVCIVSPTNRQADAKADALQGAGITAHRLSGAKSDSGKHPGVRLATIHRVKGLGFRYVFLTGMTDGALDWMIGKTQDPVERRDAENQIRSLIHVAATRASVSLFVSSPGALTRTVSL